MSSMKSKKSEAIGGDLSIALGVQRRQSKSAPPNGRPLHPSDLMEDEERASSIADAIMSKRRSIDPPNSRADLEANDEEGPASLDELNVETAMEEDESAPMLKENYSAETISDAIRRKMRAKRGE